MSSSGLRQNSPSGSVRDMEAKWQSHRVCELSKLSSFHCLLNTHMHIHMRTHTCHGTHVGVKGQTVGIHYVYLVSFRDELRLSGLMALPTKPPQQPLRE